MRLKLRCVRGPMNGREFWIDAVDLGQKEKFPVPHEVEVGNGPPDPEVKVDWAVYEVAGLDGEFYLRFLEIWNPRR